MQYEDKLQAQGLFVARDPSTITISEVLRAAGDQPQRCGDPRLAEILERLNQGQAQMIEAETVADFVTSRAREALH